jgi:hypothetical protein
MRAFREATLPDMAAHGAAKTLAGWITLRDMWANGHAWACEADGAIVALCGVYPLDDGNGEFWFWCSDNAAPHVVAFIRFGRLTLAALPYPAIVFINPSDAGRRMGLMLGFTGHCLLADKTETWACLN